VLLSKAHLAGEIDRRTFNFSSASFLIKPRTILKRQRHNKKDGGVDGVEKDGVVSLTIKSL